MYGTPRELDEVALSSAPCDGDAPWSQAGEEKRRSSSRRTHSPFPLLYCGEHFLAVGALGCRERVDLERRKRDLVLVHSQMGRQGSRQRRS